MTHIPIHISYLLCFSFYGCLKSAKTKTSEIVGKAYFNYLKRKCFTLSRKRYCALKVFWRCIEYKTGEVAKIHDPKRF